MNGFEATQKIMSERPTPIVVVSASVEAEDLKITMNALKAGALAVVEKPVGTSHEDYEALAQRLCTQLAIMSQVRVVRQRFHRSAAATTTLDDRSSYRRADWNVPIGWCQIVGMVASTGGPRALQNVLKELPSDFPAPIAVVQHITASFHGGFVRWLDSACRLSVQVAQNGQQPIPGNVYVAPPDYHLLVTEDGLRLDRGELVCSERPSGTVLFESMADAFPASAIGVLLTGMGEDGARGLAEIRRAGGYTLVEDESTAVVYGMPAAAVKLEAACESLPLEQIPRRLCQIAARVARSVEV
jgi:two-component system chemotaxis response regulator CheB